LALFDCFAWLGPAEASPIGWHVGSISVSDSRAGHVTLQLGAGGLWSPLTDAVA
jgi:hypothetical protein